MESLGISLDVAWYIVIGVAMLGYAALDGFDLGVGMLHLFSKDDYERRVFINAIGPVWDGNAVWLVIVVGGLMAGFPYAYATILSACYTPIMILLMGLIIRAVAIEFRSKSHSKAWRHCWDICFSVASYVIAFGVGIMLGNFIEGIPLDHTQDYMGSFWDFFRPYPCLVGVTTVACFMMHGSIYLVMKTENDLHDRLRQWINPAIIFFIICYGITTMATLIYEPHMIEHMRERPYLFIVALLGMLAIANIPREIHHKRDGRAFISSCFSIALLLSLYGLGNFPTLVRSSINPDENSLTIYNADASPFTLGVLMIIVAIGVPLVILYGIIVYRVFRGKVKLDYMSY